MTMANENSMNLSTAAALKGQGANQRKSQAYGPGQASKNLGDKGLTPIIEASHVSQSFTSDKGVELDVLKDISFTLYKGEIVAILGRSGAGKSTFLRNLAGLAKPTEGSVSYLGKELTGPNPGVGMVFQTFALMPWLSVQDNVELGLEARGVPKKRRARQALEAIDSIGLDGFESAYPKELSGGMRQRVGIARALVLKPSALFMDEPFSALDVLTAENLRQEVLKLWSKQERDIESVLIVTHNIEEAVQMADRVVVLGSHPGHLIAQVLVDLPRPRDKHSAEFEAMVDKLYSTLTGHSQAQEHELEMRELAGAQAGAAGERIQADGAGLSSQASNGLAQAPTGGAAGNGQTRQPGEVASGAVGMSGQAGNIDASNAINNTAETGNAGNFTTINTANTGDTVNPGNTEWPNSEEQLLPNATPGGLAGLLDAILQYQGAVDLADLASDLSFEVDDLFPLVDAGALLGILTVDDGRVQITDTGKAWQQSDILEAKQIFARLAMDHAPLVRAIDQALRRNDDGKLRGKLVRDRLRSRLTDDQADQQFETAVNWGRYGELFDYDADDDTFTLDEANA
ncbi:ABC transporter ATP-binding protein [Bifidobacterium aemilianum]|nr:nitrate/sulfonate/bicarbonate ABC transporter ATP-binding protein [Bifidobacterium aemilianum]